MRIYEVSLNHSYFHSLSVTKLVQMDHIYIAHPINCTWLFIEQQIICFFVYLLVVFVSVFQCWIQAKIMHTCRHFAQDQSSYL